MEKTLTYLYSPSIQIRLRQFDGDTAFINA